VSESLFVCVAFFFGSVGFVYVCVCVGCVCVCVCVCE
jgi:hypothetical protein